MKNKEVLINENQNKEQKLILQKFLENEKTYTYIYNKVLEKQEMKFFYITKVTYPEIFKKKIKEIIEDNFINVIPRKKDDLITAFKKCIKEVFNYANKIQIENFYNLSEIKDEKTLKKFKKQISKNDEIKKNSANSLKHSLNKIELSDKEEDADFINELFPQIKYNINSEINYNIDNDVSQRIIFCTNYLYLYMRKIPQKYKNNNYNLLFDELINETKNDITYLKTKVLIELKKKIKESEKLKDMNSYYYLQIKDLEKLKVIEYLYNNLLLSPNFKIERNQKKIITKIQYQKELNSEINNINNMIKNFPDFHENKEESDNILDFEESVSTKKALKDYFSVIKGLVKKEKIIKKYDKDELRQILYELEDHILCKLYDKLFPFESTKEDVFLYKKCKRLGFIKPENIIKGKNIINQKLCEEAIKYLDSLDDKLSPIDKIKTIGKAFEIIRNSITFMTGKDKLGVDDSLDPYLYIIIKSKPKNAYSNYKYCDLYLNSVLAKEKYGSILTQFFIIIESIKNMKYDKLIGISDEEFGEDEID